MVSAIFWQVQIQLQVHQILGVYSDTSIQVQSYRNITTLDGICGLFLEFSGRCHFLDQSALIVCIICPCTKVTTVAAHTKCLSLYFVVILTARCTPRHKNLY